MIEIRFQVSTIDTYNGLDGCFGKVVDTCALAAFQSWVSVMGKVISQDWEKSAKQSKTKRKVIFLYGALGHDARDTWIEAYGFA